MITLEKREDMWAAAGSGGQQCRECGEVFNSVSGFQAHRTHKRKFGVCEIADGMKRNMFGRWALPNESEFNFFKSNKTNE
jgi:hypothetical protein